MFTFLVVVGLVLAGQVSSDPGRYPPRNAGHGSPTNTGGGLNPSGGVSPLNLQSASGNKGGSPDAGTPAVSGNPYPASPPLGFGPPPTSARNQSPPSGYPSQPNFTGEEPPASAPANGPKPSAIMQAILTAPRESQLRGEPVTLLQCISNGRTRSEQLQRVDAYWDLCSSVADYYLSLREQDELRRLGSLVSNPGPMWQEIEKELSVRIDTSLRASHASQFRLAGLIGRPANNLPLPSDLPHCGSYTTHYQEIFAGRSSPEAQELASLLPQRYAELRDAAIALTRAEEGLDSAASARTDNTDGTAGLRAWELLALRRRAFVQIARDYNRRISRYAELATPGQVSAEQLTGMLIKRTGSTTATRSASPAPPPSRQSSGAATSPPRTFAEDWTPASNAQTKNNTSAKRDEKVRPAAAATQSPSHGERSIAGAIALNRRDFWARFIWSGPRWSGYMAAAASAIMIFYGPACSNQAFSQRQSARSD